MVQNAANRLEIGLVLQGGGALGAYEWGAVTALLELMDRAEAEGRDIVLKAVDRGLDWRHQRRLRVGCRAIRATRAGGSRRSGATCA